MVGPKTPAARRAAVYFVSTLVRRRCLVAFSLTERNAAFLARVGRKRDDGFGSREVIYLRHRDAILLEHP